MDKKNKTTKERIVELVVNKGFNVSTFFPSIGLSYANFKGRQLASSPSADVLVKILSQIPDANIEWLLTGEGEMIKDAEKLALNSNPQNDNDMLQQGLLDAIKRRDRQMDELLEQQKRLISIIETLSGASNQSRVG